MNRFHLRSPERRPAELSTLARIIPLPENRSAFLAIEEVAEAVLAGQNSVPLLLHGPPGTGKSHLVAALAEEVVCRKPDAIAQVISARDLGFGGDSEGIVEDCLDGDLLVIEDLQFLPVGAMVRLAEIWDERRAHGLALACTAAKGPAELAIVGRLVGRLAGGLVIGLTSLSTTSGALVLAALAERRDLPVRGDVLDWLAQHLTGNVRVLEGAMQQLEMLARLGRRLELDAIQGLWAEQRSEGALDRISRQVGEHFGVKTALLASSDRQRGALLPRQVSMYLARRLIGLSLGEIGRYFGGRDHTTVLHACRKIEAALTDNLLLAGAVRQLSADLA